MLLIRDIKFYTEGDEIFSEGMTKYIRKEFKIARNGLSLEELEPILDHIVLFIEEEKIQLKDGERLSCFTWVIKVMEEGDYFEILEPYPEENGFALGLSRNYHFFNQQKTVCEYLKVDPEFPLIDQLVTIDPVIKLGVPVHLFRWKKEDPDSGWYAVTNNVSEDDLPLLEHMPLGEFMLLRPECVQFLALPAGFKVIWEGNDAKIGFDERLLNGEVD